MGAMRRTAILVAVVLAACASPSPVPSAVSTGSAEALPSAVLPTASEPQWQLVDDADLFPGMINAMASSGRLLVAGGINCTSSGICEPAVWTSGNGLDWTRVAHFPADGVETIITAVGYGPVGWVAFASGAAWSSVDGQTWVRSQTGHAFDGLADRGPAIQVQEDICCGSEVRGVVNDGGTYVAVGAVTCLRCLGRAAVWRSDDLVLWDRMPYMSAFEGVPLYAVVALPGGRLVAVGTGSALVSDDTGLTWKALPAFGAASATELTILGDELVAAGFPDKVYEGAYWRSSDGVRWEPLAVDIPLPEAIPYTLASVGDSLFLSGVTREPDANRESGFIAVSNDLASWQLIPVGGGEDFRIWAFGDSDRLPVAAGNLTGEGPLPAGVWILR